MNNVLVANKFSAITKAKIRREREKVIWELERESMCFRLDEAMARLRHSSVLPRIVVEQA